MTATVQERRSYLQLDPSEEDRVRRLQDGCLVIDTIGSSVIDPEPPVIDGKSYIERALEAGVNAIGITLAAHSDDFDVFLHQAYQYLNLLEAKPETTLQIERVEDFERAKRGKKLGMIFATQTGTIVGREMWRWAVLHKVGLRIAQLTYNERNELGDGCMEPENRGITAYGRQSVQELNRLGVCIDLSHAGVRTALEITEASAKPVVYTHANPKAIGPGRRNITDEQMKTMAATGGVMGITPHSMLCHKVPGIQPTVDDMIDMLDYAVGLIGIEHVGIGSDVFDSYTKLSWETTTKRWYPSGFVFETMRAKGFGAVSEFPNVIRGLVARGYNDEDIRKILGGNWLRVFEKVWATR